MLRTILKAFGLAWLVPTPFRTVSVTQARSLVEDGQAVLFDVRNENEWRSSGLPEGAIPVSLSDRNMVRRVLDHADKNKARPVAVSCLTGARSLQAAELLVDAGFSDVINVEGGFKAWQEAGFPVVPFATLAE